MHTTSVIVVVVLAFVSDSVMSCLNRSCECCRTGKCSGENLCRGCKDGYTGLNCYSLCPPNCISCSQTYYGHDKTCNKCKQGYYNGRPEDIKELALRYDCSLFCRPGCMSCSSYKNCSACYDGFYMSLGNECIECPINCQKCSSSVDCIQCRQGHFWNNGFCQRCELNCSSCMSQNHCTECIAGFYLKGNACEKCKQECLTCGDLDTCTECHIGHYLNDKKCSQCNDFCSECSTTLDGMYLCTACEDGYFALNNICKKCAENCSSCKLETICQKCDRDYTLQNGICKICPTACQACSSDFLCTDCERGYYNSNGRCHPCRDSCTTCLTKDLCTSCIAGHSGDRCSLTCPEYCKHNQCYNESTKCVTCKDGFFFDDKKDCVKCPNHCSLCESQSSCIECEHGYKGETCNEKCLNCKEGTKCDKHNGYCFEGCNKGLSGQNCGIKCDSKCNSCDRNNSSSCTDCKTNNVSSTCSAMCSETCVSSKCNNNDGFCTLGCVIGYWGSKCQQNCSDHCKDNECTQNNGTCMRGCTTDHFSDDRCLCPNRCNCDESGNCTSCKEGFGTFCNESCSEGCIGISCFRKTGECQQGCKDGYIGSNCSKVADNNLSLSLSTGAISGVMAGSAIFGTVITAGFMVIFMKRRKTSRKRFLKVRWFSGRHKRKEKDYMDSDLDEFSTDNYITPLYSITTTSEKVDTNNTTIAVKQREILLQDLAEYVKNKTSKDFLLEFQELPHGFLKPYTESQREENLLKNRYKGIYPYDETRVVLIDGPSDYINASFISGYNTRRSYIASLGPSAKFMGDISTFWKMIWQEKCGKIVMLNELQEEEVNACDQYWPENEYSGLYNDITVTPLSEHSFVHYIVRTFEIQLKSEKRNVTQLQFTDWPEKRHMRDVTSFVDFRQKVNDVKTELEGPTLVHCSSGVGRTGTYIALDILTKEGEAEGCVDIFSCVRNLREQRVKMVQTVQQYEYLHHALVRCLTYYTRLTGSSTKRPDNPVYEPCQVEKAYSQPCLVYDVN